jgi:hypothetical protein
MIARLSTLTALVCGTVLISVTTALAWDPPRKCCYPPPLRPSSQSQSSPSSVIDMPELDLRQNTDVLPDLKPVEPMTIAPVASPRR